RPRGAREAAHRQRPARRVRRATGAHLRGGAQAQPDGAPGCGRAPHLVPQRGPRVRRPPRRDRDERCLRATKGAGDAMTQRIRRRTLRRGALGVTVGPPVLEGMLNDHGTAFAQSNPLPQRFVVVFAGQSLGGDGWERDKNLVAGQRFTEAGHFIAPASTGAAWEMTTPLEPLKDLRSEFSIVSGMKIPFSKTSAEPADVPAGGAFRDFHGGGAGPLLCGTRSQSGSFTCRSITSDQVVAKLNKGKTAVDSLVLRAQPSWYLS